MTNQGIRFLLTTVCVALAFVMNAEAQSRPRRVTPPDTLLGPEPKSPPATDTNHAYQLLQQKQYAAASKEAKKIAAADPNNSEAWKIAGFSEFYLKQYEDASGDLQKALDLQRAANHEDPHTVDALAESYVLA